MPGYDQYQRMAPQIAGSWVSGAIVPRWDANSRSFAYSFGGKAYQFDLATMAAVESGQTIAAAPGGGQAARSGRGAASAQETPLAGRGFVSQNGGQTEMTDRTAGCPPISVARGRQADCVVSPDRRLKAFYRDRNVWLANFDGSNERALTTDGSEKTRIKYGTASWVYGEELGQTTAIWWSPDSTKVGILSIRRKPGEGLLPADGPDAGAGLARRRGVSESRRRRTRWPTCSSTTSRRAAR